MSNDMKAMPVDIKAKVIELILTDSKIDDPKKVTLSSRLVEDLEADSLSVVELIMAIEKEFDIDVDDEAAQKIKTVQDIVSYVEEQLSKATS